MAVDPANTERWDDTAPVWTEEELLDTAIEPKDGHAHTHTLIYLHAFGRCGKEYTKPLLDRLAPGFPCPWVEGTSYAPGLRVVLPTARRLKLPWGPVETSWHSYREAHSNDVGDPQPLEETRGRLGEIVRDEIRRLGGAADRVFLGGLSQGCTAALDIYLREAMDLGLGGFVGSVGFIPGDRHGFTGASESFERLLANKTQGARPLWLQCATDDQWVPWGRLAEPSVQPAIGNLEGFGIKCVKGRGHVIEDWEGHILNDFVKEHAGR